MSDWRRRSRWWGDERGWTSSGIGGKVTSVVLVEMSSWRLRLGWDWGGWFEWVMRVSLMVWDGLMRWRGRVRCQIMIVGWWWCCWWWCCWWWEWVGWGVDEKWMDLNWFWHLEVFNLWFFNLLFLPSWWWRTVFAYLFIWSFVYIQPWQAICDMPSRLTAIYYLTYYSPVCYYTRMSPCTVLYVTDSHCLHSTTAYPSSTVCSLRENKPSSQRNPQPQKRSTFHIYTNFNVFVFEWAWWSSRSTIISRLWVFCFETCHRYDVWDAYVSLLSSDFIFWYHAPSFLLQYGEINKWKWKSCPFSSGEDIIFCKKNRNVCKVKWIEYTIKRK